MGNYRLQARLDFMPAKLCLWMFCLVLALLACFGARHCAAQMFGGGRDAELNARAAESMLETIVLAQESYKLMHKKFAPSLAVLVETGFLYEKAFGAITKNGESMVRYQYLFTQNECTKTTFKITATPVGGGTALVVDQNRELDELPNQPAVDRELVISLTEAPPAKILRAIVVAQNKYKEKNKKFASGLSVLVKEGLLSYKEFVDVEKDGDMTQAGEYLFTQEKCADAAYGVKAEPFGSGQHYFADQTGKVESKLQQDSGFDAVERYQNRWRLDRFLDSIATAQLAYKTEHRKYAPCLAALDKTQLRSSAFIFGDNKQTKEFKYKTLRRNGDGMQYGEHLIMQEECSDQRFKFRAIPIGKNQAYCVDISGKHDVIQTTADLKFSQALYALLKVAYAQTTYKTTNEKFAPNLAALVNADLLLQPAFKTLLKNGDSVQVGNCIFTQESCSEKAFLVSLKFVPGKGCTYFVDEKLLVYTGSSAAAPLPTPTPTPAKPAVPAKKPKPVQPPKH